ncbi:hypothetical protein L208DRAFT_453765 [Tricholoma matsutake]|nr:hypothetical protein L208DRAFT_453765 [Tricholoma matsutake 945]
MSIIKSFPHFLPFCLSTTLLACSNWVQKSLDSATEKELKIYKEEWLGECTTSWIA